MKNKEFKLYDFMNDKTFQQMDTAVECVNFLVTVKQDTLIELDGIELAIANTKLHLDLEKANTLLNTKFKELYGKDNEGIRKAHFQQENAELLWALKDYTSLKTKLLHQIDILDDMIKANSILLHNSSCTCGGE